MFSPIGKASQLKAEVVREFLRTNFEKWGLPKALRVDNGSPWATQSDIPSALALWLVGLGVKVLLNRPRQCTDNAIVERSHGVLANWVEPERAQDCSDLQTQMAWAIVMQREHYPVFKEQHRLDLYPDLVNNPRRYEREGEVDRWQLAAVLSQLSTRIWRRRVDKAGCISFFSHAYSVGRAYAGKSVIVRLDIQTQHWRIESEQGDPLKCYPAQQLSADRILGLSLAKRSSSLSHLLV